LIFDDWNPSDIEEKCINGIPLVVFGVGNQTKMFMHCSPLAKYVKCFIDNNTKYWGTNVSFGGKLYSVHSPYKVLSSEKKAIYIVTPDECADIELLLAQADVDIYSLNRRNIHYKGAMTEINFRTKLRMDLLRLGVKDNIKEYFDNEFDARAAQFLSSDYIIVPQVIFILSNKCTLKCEHCSMLMPEFKTPWEMPVEEAIKYIDNFLRGTDEVIIFNLIGGEPLIYKDLPMIIDHLQKCDKVKRITLATNCTIIPQGKMLESLKFEKVEVILSDYGNIVKMATLVELFERHKIDFRVHTDLPWLEFGDIRYREKDKETLKREFHRCFVASDCKAIFKEKYFVCERAARMHMLGNVYDATLDYVTLDLTTSDGEIRKAVQTLLSIDTADACNYCDAGKNDAKTIPAGKQIGQPLNTSGYTITKRHNKAAETSAV